MRGFVIFSTAIVLLFAVVAQGNLISRVCKAGEIFKSECSYCKCNDYGTNYNCYLTVCNQVKSRAIEFPEPEKKKMRICRPGCQWKEGNYLCECHPSGRGGRCSMTRVERIQVNYVKPQ